MSSNSKFDNPLYLQTALSKKIHHGILIMQSQRRIITLVAFIMLFIGFTAHEFYLGYTYDSNDTTNYWLRIARGSSYALLPLIALLWLPVIPLFTSAYHATSAARFLASDQFKTLHHLLGHGIFILALVHGLNYLVYYTTLDIPFTESFFGTSADIVRASETTMYGEVSDDESIDLLRTWINAGAPKAQFNDKIKPFLKEDCTKCHNVTSTMTYAQPNLPLTQYDEVIRWTHSGIASKQFRINITGILMLLAMSLMALTALKFLRQKYYAAFQRIHLMGYGIGILSLLHIPRFEWLIIPVLLLLFSYYFSRYKRHHNINIKLKPISDSINLVTISSLKYPESKGGWYINLRQTNDTEWHPFSVIDYNKKSQTAILAIKKEGDWTSHLSEKIQYDISGPFYSPIAQAPLYKDWLLIAGGIGITPMLGLINAVIRGHCKPQTINMIWVLKDPKLATWVLSYMSKIAAFKETQLSIRIYLTQHHDAIKPLDKLTQSLPIKLFIGKPEWHKTLSAIGDNQSNKPNVFLCGPERLTIDVKKFCRTQGWMTTTECF